MKLRIMETTENSNDASVEIELRQIDAQLLKEDGIRYRRIATAAIGLFLVGFWIYQDLSARAADAKNPAGTGSLVSLLYFPLMLIGFPLFLFGLIGIAGAWGRIAKLQERRRSLEQTK